MCKEEECGGERLADSEVFKAREVCPETFHELNLPDDDDNH